jgi:hypothetical protein
VVVNTRGEKGILEEPEEISVVPPAGGVSKVIRKSHGIASAVSYETDWSQQWAIEEPEEITAVPSADVVTETICLPKIVCKETFYLLALLYRRETKKLCFIHLPQSQNNNVKFMLIINPVSSE